MVVVIVGDEVMRREILFFDFGVFVGGNRFYKFLFKVEVVSGVF